MACVGQLCFDGFVFDCGGDGCPFALLPGAAVGGVVEAGALKGVGGAGAEGLAMELKSADFGEWFFVQGAVDELIDFRKGPDVAVGKFHDDADMAKFWTDEAIGFLVAVEGIGEIVGAVKEEDRALGGGEVLGGIEILEPERAGFGWHAGERTIFPDAVVAEEAAAVNGNGGFESMVETGNDAGEIAAPTDAGDSDARRIDIGKGGEERMGANDIGDGVIGPHVGDVVRGEVAEFCFVALIGSAVGEASVRTVAGKVHGQGNIAAIGPVFGPIFKGFAAATVDENDAGKWAVTLGGASEVSEDAGGFLLEWLARIIELLDVLCFRAPGDTRRVFQIRKIPGTGVVRGAAGGLAGD